MVPKPGISELLGRLAAEPRVTLGLLTGNLERGARLKLAPPDYNRYFPFGRSAATPRTGTSSRRSPSSARFAHTGRRFEGKSVVVVGDSVHDVACGRALGVRAVAVATGITSAERLAAERPDAVLRRTSPTPSARSRRSSDEDRRASSLAAARRGRASGLGSPPGRPGSARRRRGRPTTPAGREPTR